MGCRALAREPIMCQEQQASKRAGQGAREGNGVVNPFLESMYYVCCWVVLRRYLGYTRLGPRRGSADLSIAGLWESGVWWSAPS